MVRVSSIRTGLVKPNSRMLSAICRSCLRECLRAFLVQGFNSAGERCSIRGVLVIVQPLLLCPGPNGLPVAETRPQEEQIAIGHPVSRRSVANEAGKFAHSTSGPMIAAVMRRPEDRRWAGKAAARFTTKLLPTLGEHLLQLLKIAGASAAIGKLGHYGREQEQEVTNRRGSPAASRVVKECRADLPPPCAEPYKILLPRHVKKPSGQP